MNEGLLSTIQFNKSHLKAFESLSHDKNPLHTDSQYASKTSFGHRVVYGIATLITALGKWSQGQYIPIQKALIQFSKPVLDALGVNTEVGTTVDRAAVDREGGSAAVGGNELNSDDVGVAHQRRAQHIIVYLPFGVFGS